MPLEKQKLNRTLKQVLFLLGLIALGSFLCLKLSFFLSGFLGAFTLYVVLRKPQLYLTERRGIPASLSSLALLLGVLAIAGAIGYLTVSSLYHRAAAIDLDIFSHIADTLSSKVEELTGYRLLSLTSIEQLQDQIIALASSLANMTYSLLANLFMALFIAFFMLNNARPMERAVMSYIPLRPDTLAEVKAAVRQMIFSNVIGIPLVMLAQALAAAIIYWAFSLPTPLFWGFITGLFGLLPIVGTSVIWVSFGIYLIATGNLWSGIGLLAFSAAIITSIDNFLRLALMKKMADIHPLVTFLGVIVGLPLFGFMGIIFGPLLFSIFLLFLKIYKIEYR